MMTGGGRITMRDLVEEAKKRFVLLLISVFGLAYLMSLTSSSVWVNLPAAAMIFILAIYLSHDLDIRRKSTSSNNVPPSTELSKKKSIELLNSPHEKLDWKKKVNSPPVEAAIEQFTRHLVSEWVTDLWYSRITPDRNGPEELTEIINSVIGEISSRARDINLIDLLTRDVVNLISDNLELYRHCLVKIGKKKLLDLSFEQRDIQLKMVLADENKLHPALYSAATEHKVLQHLMNGFISLACKPEDLQCSFFRNVVRELLACAVIRPVVNLVNPRFINERIESLVLSHANKSGKGAAPPAEEAPIVRRKGPSVPSEDQITGLPDLSRPGVELVQFKHDNSDDRIVSNSNGQLRSMESSDHTSWIHNARSRNDNHSLVNNSHVFYSAQMTYPSRTLHSNIDGRTGAYSYGCEKAYLDAIYGRNIQALAPENFDNVWTKGRTYTSRENSNAILRQGAQVAPQGISKSHHSSFLPPNSLTQGVTQTSDRLRKGGDYEKKDKLQNVAGFNGSSQPQAFSEVIIEHAIQEEVEPDSENSYSTEDDDENIIMGIDSPGTRIWESKNKKNHGVSHIRHPLETFESNKGNKSGKTSVRHSKTSRTSSGRKRFRSSKKKIPTWHEVERTSFLLGEHLDILTASEKDLKEDSLADDNELENGERIYSGNAASSSLSSIPTSESSYSLSRSPDNYVLADTFLKLRCEVVGANIVKSGTVTFAVYSILVTDANSNNWSIKRRFRHFEELHRRLKEFPEYDLHMPPKHFLSSGLDVQVIRERCILLDIYLKKLLQLPIISGSIEVWDFLSVDSQTYFFSDSLSIIQTLSVNLDSKTTAKSKKPFGDMNSVLISSVENQSSDVEEDPTLTNKKYYEPSGLRLRKGNKQHSLAFASKEPNNLHQNHLVRNANNQHERFAMTIGNSDQQTSNLVVVADNEHESYRSTETGCDSYIPTEWVPPNLTIPILNLVDIVFQLKDGGWIRRKAFWVAKQLLQLGMGDAVDDWLVEKIHLLRKGTTIASAINHIEQILWPDGIFITKHPKRKLKAPDSSPNSQNDNPSTGISTGQQIEAEYRAKFVYEIIIDKAPVALVSLFGRKEYEQYAQDIYGFLQSEVCLKQMAFELLELLLLAAFPELDENVRQCHEEEQKFRVVSGNS